MPARSALGVDFVLNRFSLLPARQQILQRVAVNQNIPERDDSWEVGQLGGEGRIEPRELRQGFSDDDELALDGRVQQPVGDLVVEGLAVRELDDRIDGVTRIG